MKNLREWFYPTTVQEATNLLQEWGEKAMPIAGGTGVYYLRNDSIEALIDISRIGLDYLQEDKEGFRVGSLATAETIAHNEALQQPPFQVVAEAAFGVGSLAIRNGVTLGGNIVRTYPWSNLPLALLALDAQLLTTRRKEPLPATEFFKQPPHRLLEHGELLKEALLPKPTLPSGSCYYKLCRTTTDYALASVATSLSLDKEGICQQARIAIGAVVPLPRRVLEAEAILEGHPPSTERLQQAAQKVCALIQPTPDLRATPEYRKEILGVLVRRALLRSWNRSQGKNDDA